MKKILLFSILSLSLFASNGKIIYDKNCKVCHGENKDLKVFGKTRPLRDIPKKEIDNLINLYKEGKENKYGNGLLMKANLSKLSESEIKDLKEYLIK